MEKRHEAGYGLALPGVIGVHRPPDGSQRGFCATSDKKASSGCPAILRCNRSGLHCRETRGGSMKSILLASAILAALPGSAFAADALSAAPAIYDWSGAYVGVQLGYGWGHVDSHDQSISSGNSDWADSWKSNGVLGGIHLGYNQAYGSFVLGGEADIEASGMSGSVDSVFAGTIDTKIDVQG
ncbi:MAG: hypothetical protein E5V77_15310, partial [Mesorhizobium sp.]